MDLEITDAEMIVMKWAGVLLLVLAAGEVLASPQAAVAAALNDARSLPPGVREQTRYLDLSGVADKDRAELVKTVAFWANSLSRESDPAAPRAVGALLAVTLSDYGWDAAVWEKQAETEPYFNVRVIVAAQAKIRFWNRDKRAWYTRLEAKAVAVPAAAPWLDAASITELILLTNSAAPIVRADWWAAQVAINEGRGEVGYYGWLGNPKKLADFEKLVGLDRAAAQRLKKETQAIVQTSTVALHNRHILRFPTLSGVWWETFDAKENTDGRNAIRLLNGDFTHDAREIYGSLPNGLFAFFLSDAQGNRANTAPDSIASDGRAGGTDRRVHVGLSCVRCHVEGVRPIDCWARKLYRGDIRLDVTDLAKYQRLKQIYLSDLDGRIKRDQDDYAAALKACNGLTPAANAAAVAAVWDRYNEALLSVEDIARETGVEAAKVTDAIRARAQLADPILVGLLQRPAIPIQRQHFEEIQPLLWQTIGGKP